MSIGPSRIIFNDFFKSKFELFIQENAFENVVGEIVAVLSSGRWYLLLLRLECCMWYPVIYQQFTIVYRESTVHCVHACVNIEGLRTITVNHPSQHNSLATGKFEWHFRYLIFQIFSGIDSWGISCEIALRWMSLDLTDDKSTLVQVIAWWRQATTHYLSQWWPRSLSPYDITRPQWVN